MHIRSASNTNEVNWDDPLNKGLVAWYPMRQKGGNVLRDVAGENHGTLNGLMASDDWVASPETRSLALDFDGSNDYVDLSKRLMLGDGDFSLSVWFRSTSSVSGTIISDYQTTNGKWIAVELNGDLNGGVDVGAVRWGIDDGTTKKITTFVSSKSFNDGEWHHALMTRVNSADRLRTFVDGEYVGGATGVSNYGDISSSDPPAIGVTREVNVNHYSGGIGDIRIYRRSLSHAEVCDLYQASRTGYADQFKRRYFPVSLPAEEPPTETASTGLIRLKSPRQTDEVNWDDPLNKGLTAWYPFRQKGGNVLRDVVGENHGTLESSMTGADWVPSPETNSLALDFDRVNDHVDCGTGTFGILPGSYEMTLSAWCKVRTFEDYPTILSKTSVAAPYGGWQLNVDSTGRFYLGFNQSGAWTILATSSVFNTNEWYLVTATRWNGGHSIFVNGTLEGQGSGSGTIEYSNAADPVLIGRNGARSETLDGQISDLRIYNRSLSHAEVCDLYQASRTGYADQFKRRYFPVSLQTEEPPTETTSTGLIRLKSPRQSEPSYKAGYAKSASESAHPELWDGLVGAWIPAMGPTGGTVMDLSGRGYNAPFTGTWDISEEGWQTRHESDDDAIMLEQTEFPALGGAGTVVLRVKTPPTLPSFVASHLGGQGPWAGGEAWLLAVSKAGDNVAKLSYEHTGFSPTKAGPTISEDTVYSFAFTRYGSSGDWTVDTFVDGSKVSSNATASDPANSNTDGKLGHYASNTSSEWGGGIIAAMAYDRALSPNEIKQLYADPLAPFRQRRYAPFSLTTEEPPTTFNHWYALPGRIHRFIGLGVHV